MCSSPHLPMHFTTPPQSQRPPRQLPLHGRPHPPLVHLHARWTRWHGRHSSLSLYVRHVWISPQDQHFLAPSRYKATSLSCPSRVRPARAPWPPHVLAHGGPRTEMHMGILTMSSSLEVLAPTFSPWRCSPWPARRRPSSRPPRQSPSS